jgi:hypothetical protein
LLEIDKYVDYLVVIKNGEIALSKYWNKHKINLQKAYEKFYESNDTSNFD